MKLISAAIGIVPLSLMLLWFAAEAQGLPEGKGKDVVESVCAECHTLDRVAAQRLSEEGWSNVLREMTENGAAFEPGDADTILAYLAKNLGPSKLNINQATASEIEAFLDWTVAEAESVVKYRAANGKFKDISDLKKVKELEQKIEAARDRIEF